MALFVLFVETACGDPHPSTQCGDGVAQPHEQCDDGNHQAGDGCDPTCWLEWSVQPADTIVAAPGDEGLVDSTQNAQNAVNGVRGCGRHCGGVDVFSLSAAPDRGNYVVLGWSAHRVKNGPGADFVVFENAFASADEQWFFMDLVMVSVSADGVDWARFPCDYTAPDETVYVPDPEHWPGFAGRRPVLLHVEENPVNPFDPATAGGDAFDLDDLDPADPTAAQIRENGFRYIKLISAPSCINPDTGQPFVHDSLSNGADIDGVYARYVEPLARNR